MLIFGERHLRQVLGLYAARKSSEAVEFPHAAHATVQQ
jgi:hypothetical protein